MMIIDEGEYYSPSEVFSCINSVPNSRKTKMMNKRRFTDEQVKSLESIFENETKLDPKKKVQVARELGLQPRQVAIWFQNKRARYKSKQLEKDFTTLRSNYNALAKLFEELKKEKQSLVLQLEKLRDLAKDEGDYENKYSNTREATNSFESQQQEEDEKSESENNNNNTSINIDNNDHKSKTKLALPLEGSEFEGCSSILSEEGSSENTKFFAIEDQSELLKMVQPIDSSLTSGEECWDDLQSDGLFDHAVDSCQWWDFWS